MPISLKNLVGSGQSIEIGECIMMQDQPEPIIELDGMTFLKSGHVLTGEDSEYPEAYEKFGKLGEEGMDLDAWLTVDGGFDDIAIVSLGFGGGQFIAGGYSGGLATSPNGFDWTHQTSSFGSTRIAGVNYGDGMWVAVGNSGKLATSPDGINWTQRTSSFGTSTINAVAYGNGLWVAVGRDGKLATSTDGISWTQRVTPFGSEIIHGVVYGDNLWVAVSTYCIIAYSTDGIAWVESNHPRAFNTNSFAVAYGDGVYVVTGKDYLRSTNGIDWTIEDQSVASGADMKIAYGAGVFLAIGHAKASTSPDGHQWTKRIDGGTSFYGAAYGNSAFVIVGWDKTILVSEYSRVVGLPTLTQDGQSTQYMRIK